MIESHPQSVRSRHLLLTGMPGAGKTTLGRMLAERMGRPFLDTDQMIMERTGMQIVDYWASYGEFFFRSLERMVFLEALFGQPSVIATGGGLPVFMDNMILAGGHALVFIDVSPESIVNRLESGTRPLFGGKKPDLASVQALLDHRRTFYERAAWHLRCDGTPEECLNKLLSDFIDIA